jgi:pimeloyl-ACP methyl ester carboxylesterase
MHQHHLEKEHHMGTITTADGAEIFYKDWGTGQPIVFSHGWPLSADDWDTQMMFFLLHGYRVIAHDRRGHGRSTQTGDGHDMDHYADDLAAVTAHLDLHDAVHVGHSTGGGEVAHYIARHGESRVARAVLISSVPPLMLKTEANPGGLPKEVFDGLQAQVATRRSEFYREFASGPFYNYNRPGAEASEAIIENWVAPGHDRRRESAPRRDRRLLPDRLLCEMSPVTDKAAGACLPCPGAAPAGRSEAARSVGRCGAMNPPPGSSSPVSSKVTTPLQNRLQRCSGWLIMVCAGAPCLR